MLRRWLRRWLDRGPAGVAPCYWVTLHFPDAEAAAGWLNSGADLPDRYTRLLRSGERLPYHQAEREEAGQ